MQGELFSNNLAYFVALYETLDYAAAARKLPMSYQGLRKSIAKLEQGLEVELFTHNPSGRLQPTEYADILYEQAQHWLADTVHLDRQFKRIAELSRKAIYIGFANGALPFMGYELVSAFEERYPRLTLKIVEDYSTVINQALQDGEYPFVITTGPFDENIELIELARGAYYAWLPEDHPLASHESLTFADLANKTVLVLPEEEKGSATLSQIIASQVPDVDFLRVSDFFWLLAYVMQGKGVGICVDWLNGAISDHTDIASVPIESDVDWRIGLARREGAVLSDDEQCAMDFILEWFETRIRR